MQAKWGARVEPPNVLAGRFRRTVQQLKAIDARFDVWDWGDRQELLETEAESGTYPFEEIDKNLVQAIERNARAVDREPPDPLNGYWMSIGTKTGIFFTASASEGIRGGLPFTPFMNTAEFSLSPESDLSLINFEILRSVFLAINETWEATWSELLPDELRDFWTGYPVRVAWMNYVSPHYAPLMMPPPSAIVEHRPNGGLFLAATRDVFDVAHPKHLAVAREIEAALQPMSDVPNPNDAPYL
jgi:hypothetical protein